MLSNGAASSQIFMFLRSYAQGHTTMDHSYIFQCFHNPFINAVKAMKFTLSLLQRYSTNWCIIRILFSIAVKMCWLHCNHIWRFWLGMNIFLPWKLYFFAHLWYSSSVIKEHRSQSTAFGGWHPSFAGIDHYPRSSVSFLRTLYTCQDYPCCAMAA